MSLLNARGVIEIDTEAPYVRISEDDPREVHRFLGKPINWRADEGDNPPAPKQPRRPIVPEPVEFKPFEVVPYLHPDGRYSLVADLTESGLCVETHSLFASAFAGWGYYVPSPLVPSVRCVAAAAMPEARAFFRALILKHSIPVDDHYVPAVEGVEALRRSMLAPL